MRLSFNTKLCNSPLWFECALPYGFSRSLDNSHDAGMYTRFPSDLSWKVFWKLVALIWTRANLWSLYFTILAPQLTDFLQTYIHTYLYICVCARVWFCLCVCGARQLCCCKWKLNFHSFFRSGQVLRLILIVKWKALFLSMSQSQLDIMTHFLCCASLFTPLQPVWLVCVKITTFCLLIYER